MSEWTNPRFRRDLVVRRMVEGSDVRYTVYDPVRNQYIRQDIYTNYLCGLLDGEQAPEQVLAAMNRRFPQYWFQREWLDEAVEDLRKARLIEDVFQRNLMLLARAKEERRRLLSEGVKNPLELKLVTVNPTALFRVVYPWFRVMFTRWWVAGTALATLAAFGVLVQRRDALAAGFATIFTLQNSNWFGLLVLYLTLFVIVLLHEFGHGLCCMHYGGQPRKLGIQLFYLMPAMFCDVSDIYFFDRRWPRAAVALAGGYVELQTFALGTLVWAVTPPDLLVHEIAYRVMLFSGITGLIFNYNPLIKLDGYYVLMFWLDIQDLRERAMAYLKARLAALVTRKPAVTERLTRREKRIFLIYGASAFLYSVVFVSGMLLLVRQVIVARYHEVGFAVLALLFYKFTRGLWKGLFRWGRLLAVERAGTIRRHWALWAGGAAAAVLLGLVPLPRTVKLEAVLAPLEGRVVRAPGPGRVGGVLVEEGAAVREGTVLAFLASDREAAERATALSGREQAALAERSLRGRRLATEAAVLEAAVARSAGREWQAREAWIAAPGAGRVLTARPGSLRGREVARGDSLLLLGRTDSLEVRLQVTEREVGDLEAGRPASLRLRAEPGRTRAFRLAVVDLAPYAPQPGVGDAVQLADPESPPSRFRAAGVIANPGERLRPGMSGVVRLRTRPMTFFARIGRAYARVVRADFWL